ncbi:hypothetical protein B0H16DRAFT_1551985 [Mycena metata]|uniref:Uncharacterized protein n=1 Tax=Mycena metata TaxID=1033252 RepID=A0AAD7IUU5_9AGAR|nr:hypothetical protein B0H16DRAFT_1551985 [Mycena metata]
MRAVSGVCISANAGPSRRYAAVAEMGNDFLICTHQTSGPGDMIRGVPKQPFAASITPVCREECRLCEGFYVHRSAQLNPHAHVGIHPFKLPTVVQSSSTFSQLRPVSIAFGPASASTPTPCHERHNRKMEFRNILRPLSLHPPKYGALASSIYGFHLPGFIRPYVSLFPSLF